MVTCHALSLDVLKRSFWIVLKRGRPLSPVLHYPIQRTTSTLLSFRGHALFMRTPLHSHLALSPDPERVHGHGINLRATGVS